MVLARMQLGMTDESATRSPRRPCTLPCWSTTAIASDEGPILHVPHMCCPVLTSRSSHRSSVSVRLQVGVRRRDPRVQDVLERLLPTQPDAEVHGLPQPLAVDGVLQEPVVQGRLDARVRRGQPQLTPALGEVQQGPHTPCLSEVRGSPPLRICSVAEGEHHELHVVAQVSDPSAVYRSTDWNRAASGSMGWSLLDAPGDVGGGMVPQVLPDSGQVVDHGNAHARSGSQPARPPTA